MQTTVLVFFVLYHRKEILPYLHSNDCQLAQSHSLVLVYNISAAIITSGGDFNYNLSSHKNV